MVLLLGLLKNYKGEPYKDKASISKVVQSLKWTSKKTPWGVAKVISKSEIDKYNKGRLLEN